MLITRRRLLQAATAAAGLGLYTWQWEPHWLEVVRLDLAVRQLPSSLIGRTLYVNRGVGHLFRVRFNVRPEVTVFTLQRA